MHWKLQVGLPLSKRQRMALWFLPQIVHIFLLEADGHKSIATTQRYIDVNDELKRSAVEMI